MRRYRAWLGAFAIDTAAVLVFVVAGRDSHDSDATLGAILGVAAPFLIGLAAGTIAVAALGRTPLSWSGGLIPWAATLVLGMLLRRFAWDRGTALSFVIVTAAVLGALFLGWRALWVTIGGRRAVRSAGPPTAAES